jgi:hypothetical protein
VLRQGFVSDPGSPWYHAGLRFHCTQCGNCCSGAPGYVWVSVDECGQIAAFLGVERDPFTRKHVRRAGTRLSLLEKRNGDCEFLVRHENGKTTCSIHPVRPVQCRTWPFWKSNLTSAEAWKEAGKDCPGMDQGRHHPLPVIQAALTRTGDLPL